MGAFPIGQEKEVQLTQRMATLGVREADVEETFVRSGGHGGQNVQQDGHLRDVVCTGRPACRSNARPRANRASTASSPASCSSIKSKRARESRADAERARLEKLRRSKRGRSRAAKQRMLADKSHHAAKKEFRRRAPME